MVTDAEIKELRRSNPFDMDIDLEEVSVEVMKYFVEEGLELEE